MMHRLIAASNASIKYVCLVKIVHCEINNEYNFLETWIGYYKLYFSRYTEIEREYEIFTLYTTMKLIRVIFL